MTRPTAICGINDFSGVKVKYHQQPTLTLLHLPNFYTKEDPYTLATMAL
jgi:hypothetical protein